MLVLGRLPSLCLSLCHPTHHPLALLGPFASLPQATEQHNVHTIIYLSCGFAAFMRDFDELVGCGRWRAVHSEAFIFFPGADHIETLAVFQRAEGHQAEQVAPL